MIILINLRYDELCNYKSWSELWTSSCSVGQPIGLFRYDVSSGWIQSTPTLSSKFSHNVFSCVFNVYSCVFNVCL